MTTDRITNAVVARSLRADAGVLPLYQSALDAIRKLKVWSSGFDASLRESKKDTLGLPPGHVWQDEWIEYWKPFDPIERQLYKLSDDIGDASVKDPELSKIWQATMQKVDPPRGARVEDAIATPRFIHRPTTGREHIAYLEDDLVRWRKNFDKWLDSTENTLIKTISKIRRL